MKHFFQAQSGWLFQCNMVLWFILVIQIVGIAQNAAIQWDKTFGGTFDDVLRSVQPTHDGGYILGGYSESNKLHDKTENSKGYLDYWVIKLDASGKKVWDKTIGGNGYDMLNSVHPTYDGGYILGGHSMSDNSGDKTKNSKGSEDYWVVKLDAAGNKMWDKTIGGRDIDILNFLYPTADGGYILAGYSLSDKSGDKTEDSKGGWDYWVVKLDAAGNKVWDKCIGGDSVDIAESIFPTADGGYVLGGRSVSNMSGDKTENSKGGSDYWVVKLDATGNKVWDKTIGGDGNDGLKSVYPTADGGYVLGGGSVSNVSGDKTENSKGGSDYWMVKLDATGNKVWDRTIGGDSNDGLASLYPTADGAYILAGHSLSDKSGDKTEDSNGGWDYWIVKLDASANKVWDKTIGGSRDDVLSALQPTADGCYVLGGWSWSNISGDKTEYLRGKIDYWVVKLIDPDNLYICHCTQSGHWASLSVNPGTVSHHLEHGDYLGQCSETSNTAKRGSSTFSEARGSIPSELKIYNYPNPFNTTTTIKYELPFDGNVSIKVYDLTGRELATVINRYQQAGDYTIGFNAADLANGIYFYRISMHSGQNHLTASGKMLIVR